MSYNNKIKTTNQEISIKIISKFNKLDYVVLYIFRIYYTEALILFHNFYWVGNSFATFSERNSPMKLLISASLSTPYNNKNYT